MFFYGLFYVIFVAVWRRFDIFDNQNRGALPHTPQGACPLTRTFLLDFHTKNQFFVEVVLRNAVLGQV